MPHWRYILFLAVLALAMACARAILPWVEAGLVAFDLAVSVFVATCVRLWRDGPGHRMRRQAERDDAGGVLLLVMTALISATVLAALSMLILNEQALGPGDVALLVMTLLASWLFANLIYAFHYARLYYSARERDDRRGLDFPGDVTPEFSDFVNFAFVIGMTCQTADIAITDAGVRRVVTFHGLYAFVFNLGILALTVNVLASGAQ